MEMKKEYYEEVRNFGIEVGKKVIEQGKQRLPRKELYDFVWNECWKEDYHLDFAEVMIQVDRIISNRYLMQ